LYKIPECHVCVIGEFQEFAGSAPKTALPATLVRGGLGPLSESCFTDCAFCASSGTRNQNGREQFVWGEDASIAAEDSEARGEPRNLS
jgi:hypothetical protein